VKQVGIIGFGPLGKQLFNMLIEDEWKEENIFIFDDNIKVDNKHLFRFNEYNRFKDNLEFIITLGYHNLKIKNEIIKELLHNNYILFSFIHKNAYVHPLAKVGKSVIIFPGSIIEQNAQIMDGGICYDSTIVAHDCVIYKAVFIAPSVTICGYTSIGEESFIGAGTIVGNNLNVGKNVKIGMASAVQKDINDDICALGNPLKIVKNLELI